MVLAYRFEIRCRVSHLRRAGDGRSRLPIRRTEDRVAIASVRRHRSHRGRHATELAPGRGRWSPAALCRTAGLHARRRSTVVRMMKFALFLTVFGGISACGDDDHSTDAATFAQSCQDIIDACHDVAEVAGGRAGECHDTAHDVGTATACDPIAEECVTLCESLEADGGGEDDHDGGTEH